MVVERVMVVSTAVGGGHKAAAAAVAAALAESYPAMAIRNLDILDHTSRWVARFYSWSYHFMAGKALLLWAISFDQTDKPPTGSIPFRKGPPGSTLLDRYLYRRFLREVEQFDPDWIVCTHFLPADMLQILRARGKLRAKVAVVVTDFGVMHRYWCCPADLYCVANEEIKQQIAQIEQMAYPPESVRVTGIPIRPVFSRSVTEADRAQVAEWLQLVPDQPTITVTAGGWLTDGSERIAKILTALKHPVNLVFLVGPNRQMEERMRRSAWPSHLNVTVLGYTDRMHDVMKVTDLMITKPGGLTTAECLASGVGMVVVFPVPGQEDRNCDWLLENGAAIKVQNLPLLAYKINRLLDRPERLRTLKDNARALGLPKAAFTIADALCGENATC